MDVVVPSPDPTPPAHARQADAPTHHVHDAPLQRSRLRSGDCVRLRPTAERPGAGVRDRCAGVLFHTGPRSRRRCVCAPVGGSQGLRCCTGPRRNGTPQGLYIIALISMTSQRGTGRDDRGDRAAAEEGLRSGRPRLRQDTDMRSARPRLRRTLEVVGDLARGGFEWGGG
jgi:hypothetical protein